MKKLNPDNVIGLREWVSLPELGLDTLRAKVDTGARTSALHATDIEQFERDGQPWVRFTAHFGSLARARDRICEAPLVNRKTIKSSTGHSQNRYVIRTRLALGARSWPVEFTLTCRQTMRYRLLLGSKALLEGHLLVDPSQSYLQPKAQLPSTSTKPSTTGAA